MIDLKKMDEKDFVFINKPLSEKEEKEFSEFLKSKRKRKTLKARTSLSKTKRKLQNQ